MHRLRPRDRSLVWLTLYSVCLLLVLSFVFFEMLDVDGSDFKALTTPGRAGLRQSTTEEDADGVRRVVLQVTVLAWITITSGLRSVATAVPAGPSRATPVAVVGPHTHRIALPRAS